MTTSIFLSKLIIVTPRICTSNPSLLPRIQNPVVIKANPVHKTGKPKIDSHAGRAGEYSMPK